MDNNISILLVEDQKLIRAGIKSIFDEAEGFCVIGEADTGRKAVQTAAVLKPDIILLDIALPDISGIKVIKELKEKGCTSKIIVLTASDSSKEISECLALGIYGWVLKDTNTDMLLNIVKDVYNGAVRIAPQAVSALRNNKKPVLSEKNVTRAEFRNSHADLTRREYEVLKLIVDGKSNSEIAEALCISSHTAKAHVCSIIQKLVVDDRTQAAVKALKEGLIY